MANNAHLMSMDPWEIFTLDSYTMLKIDLKVVFQW